MSKWATQTITRLPPNPTRPPKGLTRAGRNAAFGALRTPHVVIEVTGLRVLEQHMQAVAYMTHNLSVRALQLCGAYCADLARDNLAIPLKANKAGRAHVRTAELWMSIFPGVDGKEFAIDSNGDTMWIDITAGAGLPDARARFLEWGFRHVQSRTFVRYPYMMPALDKTAIVLRRTVVAIATIPTKWPSWDPILNHPASKASIATTRAFLYSASKAMGDIQVFIGSPFIGRMRGYTLMAAKQLGNLNAVMRGAIATRVSSLTLGRIAGQIQAGMRMPTLTAPSSYSGMANRVYNRFIGRGFGLSIHDLMRRS